MVIPFVRHLPTASGGRVEVVVHEFPLPMIESGRCGRWIDFVHAPFVEGDPTRADQDWGWRWKIPIFTFGGGFVRRPRMFQICLAGDDFPIAMVALLENERWIEDFSQSAVYVFYLTGAPAAAVATRGAPKLLTSAALDVGITVSLNGPAGGRLWLHAAPEGKSGLLDWYHSRGLERVLGDAKLPGSRVVPRVNDGRYFQLTPVTAKSASKTMDEYRS